MNKSNAHLFIPIITAMAAGKVIEFNNGTKSEPRWDEQDSLAFAGDPEEYRIKPDPPKVMYVNEYETRGTNIIHGYGYKTAEEAAANSGAYCVRKGVKYIEVIE